MDKISGGFGVRIPVKSSTAGTVLMLLGQEGSEAVQKSLVIGQAMVAVLDGSATVTVKDEGQFFADVGKEHWSGDAVSFVSARALFRGTQAQEFSPNMPMSRAMLVTVLNRLEHEVKAGQAMVFDDVEDQSWYSNAVSWAASQKIVMGTGAGFDPEGHISREALATMLYRYISTTTPDIGIDGDGIKAFEDVNLVSPWAEEAIA